jgi:hypothetical protein
MFAEDIILLQLPYGTRAILFGQMNFPIVTLADLRPVNTIRLAYMLLVAAAV